MSKWPWPERLKRIVRSSPSSSAARAASSAPWIACADSGAGMIPSAAREAHRRGEDVVLQVGLGADQPVEDELRDERRHAVVAQAARVDRRRHEVVAERVHRDERRQLARVAEVVGEVAARQRRAGGRLAGEDVDVAPGDLLAQEREREPGEVRAAADAADDDVRERAGQLHLRERLLADHRLVQQHVVEHAAERVRRVVARRRRPRPPPRSRCRGCRASRGAPRGSRGRRSCPRDGLGDDLAPQVCIIERRYGFWSYETRPCRPCTRARSSLQANASALPHWPAPVSVERRVRPSRLL